MAGLGFKDFAVGEVLTAADVDGYLMQQTVMRFADSGARGSALGTATGTAVALAEGMVSYIDDTNAMQVFDGTAWRSPVAGLGGNVVQAVLTTAFSTGTTGSFVPVTGLDVTITPTQASAKVLVAVSLHGANSAASDVSWRLMRGATAIGTATAGTTASTGFVRVVDTDFIGPASMVYVDSPGVTTATTYSVEIRGASGTTYVNRRGRDATYGTISTITAVEVAP